MAAMMTSQSIHPPAYPPFIHSPWNIEPGDADVAVSDSPSPTTPSYNDNDNDKEDNSTASVVNEKKLMLKIDTHVLPILCVLYFFAFLDR